MNHKLFLHRAVVVAFCFFLVLMVDGSNPGKSFSASKSVVLYSSNRQSAIDLSVAMFKKKHPDISVSVVRAGTGALMKRIVAEKDRPLGDVFWSGGFGVLGAYKDNFAPYLSPEAKAIPDTFIQPNNLWTGVNVHVMVVMANLKLVSEKELPKKWTDLFDPKWKDKVVIADPLTASSAYLQVYGLYKTYGEDGLRNFLRVARELADASAIYRSVGLGEYPLGITMEYAAYEYVAGGAKEIKLIYPEDGTFLSPEGVALIKGCKNLEAAKLLYDFYCSREAQEAVLRENFRRPTRADIGVEKIADLPSMKSIKVIGLDQDKASEDFERVTKIWDKIKKELRK
ncbi:MAG: extracellular solute-binding protein [Thermodesulfobacteriota bacterium]|nr:extracellular solute-binding protein [Thermodesulfobacteriota bacterium]